MATTTTTPNNHQFTDLQQEEPNPNSYALSGKIMLASIIILFAVVIFLLLLHLYARWYLLRLHRRNHHHRRNRHNRSTRIIFYLDPTTPTTTTSALDPSILKTLPLFVYSPENDKNTPPECAVCLSEFEKGETGRVLPKCGHSFHTECIDMWFHSNSTCPLCRSPVEAAAGESETAVLVQPSPEFIMCEPVRPGSGVLLSSPPVRPGLGGLYSGLPVRPGSSESETTSLGDRRKGMDVRIDVPNRNELLAAAADNEFRLVSPSHGFRSPASRLLALKRILSMGRRSPAASPSAAGVGTSRLPAAAESDLESARLEGGGNNVR